MNPFAKGNKKANAKIEGDWTINQPLTGMLGGSQTTLGVSGEAGMLQNHI